MKADEVEILLVEDNPTDVELTLRALKKHNFANNVHVVTDGEQALEFIFATGTYKGREVLDQEVSLWAFCQLPSPCRNR